MKINSNLASVRVRRFYQVVFGSRTALIIFLMTLFAYGYFFHRFRFWNVSSRLALTYAIVDDHSFHIDKYVNHPFYETRDRAFFKGHYYSDKSIGLSILAVPPYWLIKQAFSLIHKESKPDLSRYGLTVAIISLSSSLLMIVLLRILTMLGQPMPMASLIVLLFAFGTMLFPFSSLFYPYLPALFFLVSAFYLIIRWNKDGVLDRRPAWMVGLLVGLALFCEYTLSIPAVLITAYYAIALSKRSKLISYMACAALPLIFFAFYNLICFETIFTIPYQYLDDPEFKKGMSQGLMGIRDFQWYVLWLITLHPYRGIFFYSPFLLLGFVGIWRGLTHQNKDERGLAFIILATVIYYLVLNASYYMWWGGGTLLARHLIPMLPFLAIAFAWLPMRLKPLLAWLGIISIIFIGIQSVVEPHYEPEESNEALYHPWQTVQRTGDGFVPVFLQHAWPAFLKGRISMNPFNRAIFATDGKGWTLIPLIVVELLLLMGLRRSLAAGDRPRRRAAPGQWVRAHQHGQCHPVVRPVDPAARISLFK